MVENIYDFLVSVSGINLEAASQYQLDALATASIALPCLLCIILIYAILKFLSSFWK
jgi:hypothetical protein